jgi:type I restriction enzyme, R subunit
MKPITENQIEEYAIEELVVLGYEYLHGGIISPGGEGQERESFEQVLLIDRLRNAVARINPQISQQAREQAIQKAAKLYGPELQSNNEEFHSLLIEKIKVPYTLDGFERSHEIALIDFENVDEQRISRVVNQFTIIENNQNKRPDVILFVNGIPLVVLELKNPADEKATTHSAFNQIETYKSVIPTLFQLQCVLRHLRWTSRHVPELSLPDILDFMAWKSADGEKDASKYTPQLETLIKGMLNRETLLDLVRNFIVFEKSKRKMQRPESRRLKRSRSSPPTISITP